MQTYNDIMELADQVAALSDADAQLTAIAEAVDNIDIAERLDSLYEEVRAKGPASLGWYDERSKEVGIRAIVEGEIAMLAGMDHHHWA